MIEGGRGAGGEVWGGEERRVGCSEVEGSGRGGGWVEEEGLGWGAEEVSGKGAGVESGIAWSGGMDAVTVTGVTWGGRGGGRGGGRA